MGERQLVLQPSVGKGAQVDVAIAVRAQLDAGGGHVAERAPGQGGQIRASQR